MSRKLNCWEYMDCGRQPGGLMVGILGECPVAATMKLDGLNEGIGAGRACWMVQSSACRLDASRAGRPNPCHSCRFYHRVVFEEAENTCFKYSTTVA